jgi:hypothetical protein
MKQLTLVVDDEVGKLANISFILGKSKINIDSVSAGIIGGKGIIHLSVKDYERAKQVLEANNYECLESDVFVVKLKNEPGALAEMSKMLSDNRINILNFAAITQDKENSVYSLKVDDHKKAEKLLADYLDIES